MRPLLASPIALARLDIYTPIAYTSTCTLLAYTTPMELVEAPPRLPGMFLITWTMTRIESCRMGSQITRNWATSCLAQEDFGSSAGLTRGVGKGAEAVFGLFITTSYRISRSG